jgi:hypothetical protein
VLTYGNGCGLAVGLGLEPSGTRIRHPDLHRP